MKSRICVVVRDNNLNDFIKTINKAQKIADILELRVDYIAEFNSDMLKTFAKQTKIPAIVCCRSKNEGGEFTGTLDEQNHILQTANDLGFWAIDIDLNIADEITIQNKQAQLIISYHNFDKTPSLDEINQLTKQIRKHKPDILKLATMNHTENDARLLLAFLLNKRPTEEMIVLGMGEAGKITRILSPLLGGYLTFASLNNQPSAPGQIDVNTLKDLYLKLEEVL